MKQTTRANNTSIEPGAQQTSVNDETLDPDIQEWLDQATLLLKQAATTAAKRSPSQSRAFNLQFQEHTKYGAIEALTVQFLGHERRWSPAGSHDCKP